MQVDGDHGFSSHEGDLSFSFLQEPPTLELHSRIIVPVGIPKGVGLLQRKEERVLNRAEKERSATIKSVHFFNHEYGLSLCLTQTHGILGYRPFPPMPPSH